MPDTKQFKIGKNSANALRVVVSQLNALQTALQNGQDKYQALLATHQTQLAGLILDNDMAVEDFPSYEIVEEDGQNYIRARAVEEQK